MMYDDLFHATDMLGRKLYSFTGHSVDPTHTSYMWNVLRRGIDYINAHKAVVSLSYDCKMYVGGHTIDCMLTLHKTKDVFSPVRIDVQTKSAFEAFS